MVRRRKKGIIIWTVFFDSSRSRNLGRKVPRSLAVRYPTVEELEEAIRELGFEYEVEKDKKYPKTWYLDTCQGYVRIYKKPDMNVTRTKLLKMIAQKLKEIRRRRVEKI